MKDFRRSVFLLFLGLIGSSMAARAESAFTGMAGNSRNEAQQSYLGISESDGGRIAIGTSLSEQICRKMIEIDAYPSRAKWRVQGAVAFSNLYPGVTVNLQPGDNWTDDEQYHGTFRFVDATCGGLILVAR